MYPIGIFVTPVIGKTQTNFSWKRIIVVEAVNVLKKLPLATINLWNMKFQNPNRLLLWGLSQETFRKSVLEKE